MSSVELTTEPSELSGGMLGIIRAYAMHTALDVRDLYRKGESETASRGSGLSDAPNHEVWEPVRAVGVLSAAR